MGEGGRDYQKIAGDILFGGERLDNAVRGLFMEAVLFHALCEHDDRGNRPHRWRYAGVGWGPWDLQRGTGEACDRVRVQVKISAATQVWQPAAKRGVTFSLGWKARNELPKYFKRDFPESIYGLCEPSGYRTDLFLLGWHVAGPQSDPDNYRFAIVPVDEFISRSPSPPKSLTLTELETRGSSISFADCQSALNFDPGSAWKIDPCGACTVRF